MAVAVDLPCHSLFNIAFSSLRCLCGVARAGFVRHLIMNQMCSRFVILYSLFLIIKRCFQIIKTMNNRNICVLQSLYFRVRFFIKTQQPTSKINLQFYRIKQKKNKNLN